MDMKTYLKQAAPEARETLATKVGSSVAYFYQIAGGHKKPGPQLCKALVDAEPLLTLAELRPDIWSQDFVPATDNKSDVRESTGRIGRALPNVDRDMS